VTAATDRIQGWISDRYGERLAAPVVQVVKEGRSARYVTLLVPGSETARATITGLVIAASGFAFPVTIDGRTERVVVDGASATIVDAELGVAAGSSPSTAAPYRGMAQVGGRGR